MDSSISILNSSVTELEKDNQNLFEKFTFESVITKLERPIGKGCPVYVMNASTGTIIHKTETDALSKVYIPNLRKYNKYLVIAADLQDIYNSVVFDVTWDFNKNLAYNYSLTYYDISNLDNIQAFFEYQEYEKATDQNVVVSLSHPYAKDTSGIAWSTTGTTYRDNVRGIQGFRFLNSNTYLPKSVFYQNLPFTFEAYFKLYGTSNTNQNILYQVNSSSSYFSIHIDPNLNLVFRRQSVVSGISDITMTSLTSLKIDGNYHVALSYDGTSFYLFLNGVLQTTLNDPDGLPYVNTPLYVGHSYNGVISHPLITQACKYTTSFDVLFKAFSYDPVVYNNPADSFANYVMLLIKNNDKTIQKMVDDKARNIRFENNVDENSTKEFFNVSTHNPTINSYTNLPLGTKDFCIEVSAKVLSKLSATPMLASNIATNTQWAANNWAITFNSNANPNKFGLTAYNTTHWATIYPAILKEQFTLAVVREGTKLRFYINGFLDSENTIAANLNFDNRSSSFFSFGKDIYVNLYDLKFTLGSPRYTANYEPALIDIEDKVLLATQYQYVNLPFKKSLTDPNTPLTITNTSVSLSSLQSINGTSSALFDGTSSKLSLASWYTGKEKFTVEMAVLPENLATIQTLFSLYSATVEFIKVGIKDNKLGYYDGTVWVDTSYVFTPNTFNHIVIKRDKTQLKILANGGLVATITLASDIGMNLTACVGASKGTTDFFKGHLNNLYIYKNYIKYTDTYEVPVEEQVTDPTELEPVVVVNQYTTAALDFENGLIDKVPTTVWNKEGTAAVTSVNKIFGNNSFETKALGDSLYTNSNIITGGATPFTIEFYSLIGKQHGWTIAGYTQAPLFSKNGSSSQTNQQVHVNFALGGKIQLERHVNTGATLLSTGNININYNEINKYTISYDGSAYRFFVNDKLDHSVGTLNAFNMSMNQPFKFLDSFVPGYSSYRTGIQGIIDNINIFDGEARVVRDYDEHADKLIVDLAFDGENNSTKIVDNGTLKSNWNISGGAKISTSKPFNGFSSLDLNGTSADVNTLTNIVIHPSKKMTIEFMYNRTSGSSTASLVQFYVTNDVRLSLYTRTITNPCVYINGSTIIDVQLPYLEMNKDIKYRCTIDNGVYRLYINDIFVGTGTSTGNISSPRIWLGHKGDGNEQFKGYIKNLKIYEDVAITPESPVGKIQLDFDNNLNDTYNNSTWITNSVTFDQVNSVKGSAAYFDNTSDYIETNSSALDFGTNNFKMSFDLKETVKNGGAEILSNNLSPATSGSIWIPTSTTNVGFDYYPKQSNLQGLSSLVLVNNYYKHDYIRQNGVLSKKTNGVLVGSQNIPNDVSFNLVNGGTCRFGKTNTGFGSYNGFVGYLDNFSSINQYDEPVVIDNSTIHLPLETNAVNIGYSTLVPTLVGNPTFITQATKKCVKFESGKYITFPSSNIFTLGTSTDFYIQFDFYVLGNTSIQGILSGTHSSAGANNAIIYIESNGKLVLRTGNNTNPKYFSSLQAVTINEWQQGKIYREGSKITIELNGIVNVTTVVHDIDFSLSSTVLLGGYATVSSYFLNGYLSNFKMFVGTSKVPETYHDNKVLNLDFKPTRKSYLFEDKNNKCVIHPTGITQRDYQNSRYCCAFNGSDQWLQLGKNDLLNFGSDDFIINFKIKIDAYSTYWRILLGNNTTASTTNDYAYIGITTSADAVKPNSLCFNIQYTSTTFFRVYANSPMPLNEIVDIVFVRNNGVITLTMNDIPVTLTETSNLPLTTVNWNLGDNTFLGNTGVSGGIHKFLGTMYNVKLLRNTTDISLLQDSTGEVVVDPRPPIDYTKRPYTVRFNFENNLNDAVSGSALTMSTGVATYGTAATKEVSSLASFDFGDSSTIRDMQLPSDLKPKFNLTGDFTLGFDIFLRSAPTGTKHILTANPYGSYTRDTSIRLYENSQDPTKFMIRLENNIDSSTYEYVQIIHPLLAFNTNINVKFIRKGNAIRAYINNYFVTEVAWNTVVNFNRYAGPLFGNYTVGNTYTPDMLLDTFFIYDNYVETFHAVEYTA